MKLKINKKIILEEAYTKAQLVSQLASIPVGAAIGVGGTYLGGVDDSLIPTGAALGGTVGLLGSGIYLSKYTPEGQALNKRFNKIHQRDIEVAKMNGDMNPVTKAIYN